MAKSAETATTEAPGSSKTLSKRTSKLPNRYAESSPNKAQKHLSAAKASTEATEVSTATDSQADSSNSTGQVGLFDSPQMQKLAQGFINDANEKLQKQYDQLKDTITQDFEKRFAELGRTLQDQLDHQVSMQVAPLLEQQRVMQVETNELKDKVRQLEERLTSSQLCSPSQAATAEKGAWSRHQSPLASKPSGQLESAVYKLASYEMQKQDEADKDARDKKGLNAILRNFEHSSDETQENLEVKVNALFAETLQTSVTCASARRIKRNSATLDHVLVQFAHKKDKQTVFRARGKLAGTPIGMDDDLTQLQQQRKNAAWPAFKEARAKGLRTQWRAEQLWVKEGEHFVQHKVLDL